MRKLTMAEYAPLPGFRIGNGVVAILRPGEVVHSADRDPPPDRHLIFILEGRGRIHVDGRAVGFTTGEMLLVEGSEPHRLEASNTVVTAWLHLLRA